MEILSPEQQFKKRICEVQTLINKENKAHSTTLTELTHQRKLSKWSINIQLVFDLKARCDQIELVIIALEEYRDYLIAMHDTEDDPKDESDS